MMLIHVFMIVTAVYLLIGFGLARLLAIGWDEPKALICVTTLWLPVAIIIVVFALVIAWLCRGEGDDDDQDYEDEGDEDESATVI